MNSESCMGMWKSNKLCRRSRLLTSDYIKNYILNTFLFSEKHCQRLGKTHEIKTILLLDCVLKTCAFYGKYIYINK